MKTKVRYVLFASLSLIAAIWMADGAASAQNLDQLGDFAQADHFQCYFVPNLQVFPVPEGLQLQDQFSPGFVPFVDLRLVRLCNPVAKLHKHQRFPIQHPLNHLTFYQLNPTPTVPRRALVVNQFGRQELHLRDAKVLAVPTKKWLPGQPEPAAPQGLDHYECYTASGKEINDPVLLHDQFQPPGIGLAAAVLEPALFCNPVRKLHGANAVGVEHADLHLTCYTIHAPPFAAQVNIKNQFLPAGGVIPVVQADLLCAPTAKLRWEVVQPGNPGPFPD